MGSRLLRRLPLAVAIAGIAFGWIGLNLDGDYFRDAMAYWRPDLDDLYGGRRVGIMSTYLYSPAFAQLMWPFGLLPWPLFAALWSALNLGVLVWMVGPYLAALLFLVPGPVGDEISTGNIHLLLAATIVIGFRYPAAWSFHLLTKITPGIGILWFAGARQWRALVIGIGASVAIAVVSFVIAPSAWFEWLETLRLSSTIPADEVAVIPGPLWLRGAVAALLALAAGWLGVRWLVPVAALIALPVPWSSGLSLLVGSLALTRATWQAWIGDAWRTIGTRGRS
ncbi:MAG: DUF2029 domain-containing protein [Chloroflexota bacterium]|nr:DUF2029 domain-containing protein [Chloroflexota bacterium]